MTIENHNTFNRYELKYVLPIAKCNKIIKDLEVYVVPDSYGDALGRYMLTSLYYDTTDFRFYHEKINGLKHRKKLRIRIYENQEQVTEDTLVYVEVKERIDRIIRKRRVSMKLKDALAFCGDENALELNIQPDKVLSEFRYMLRMYHLRPTIITSYQRQAFHGTKYDRGLRITFDTNMRYRRNNLDLTKKDFGEFMLPPDVCIMEIKVNNSIPLWLTQIIAKHELQIYRISKYCTSLECATEKINKCIIH
ncbi:MAG: polyphosphate polymerase domain-containing protein [Patescibacteria group bacterium]